MAVTTQVIRELTIKAREEGAEQVRRALAGVADAQREVAASAEGMAKTTETSARRQQSAAGGLRRVEAQLDGVVRATRAYEMQQRQLDRAFDQGLVSQQRYAEMTKQAQAALTVASVQAQTRMRIQAANANDVLGIGDAPEKIRLTANQMTGLGYQINDVATMLAMGASPFQVISSQAGQVVQVLGEGPGGMKGSLSAIGTSLLSLATPTTAVVAGLTAAGAAAIYFATRGEDKIKPLNEAMEAHRKIIGEIAASYGAAINARDSYASGATRAFGLRQSADELRLSSRTSLLDNGFAGNARLRLRSTEDGGRVYTARDDYKAFEGPLVKLAQGLRTGTDDARAFVDEVSRIANLDPANEKLQEIAKELLELAKPAADAKQQLDALTNSFLEMQRVAARGRINSATEAFGSFLPETKTIREQIAQAYTLRAGAIDGLSDSNPRVAEGLRIANANDLAKALGEVERQESVIRQGRALDIREVNARTTAERAAIAAARERANLSGTAMEAGEREAQIAHAAAMVYAEDSRRMSDAARDRSRSYQDMVTSLQTESATLDMTRGAAMAYQRQQELIVQLYRDAADEGRIVDPAEVEEIKRVTAAAGALTDQIARLNAMREQEEELRGLASRASTIGGTDDEARRASALYDMQRRLREQNEDPNSAYGRASIGNALKLSDLDDQIRRSADAWDDWRGAGEGAIDSVVDALASGTADIGDVLKGVASDFTKTFLQLAVSNPLKNMIIGTSLGTINDLFKKTAMPSLEDAGVKSFGTVAMTAAVVNLDGSPLGLGALASNAGGGTGAAGAIGRLLNPANGNSTVAAAGSGALNFVGNYKSGVDSKLTAILQEAAKVSGLKVEAFSGLRPGDSRFHGKGLATDIRLFDQAGKAIPNYQNAGGFRAYEQFAQVAKQVQMERFPELADKFRWGGYFGGQKGKYGAMDTMHFDTGGAGMAGGSWAKGLNATQRARFPGAESIGMADRSFKEIEKGAGSMASSFALTSGKIVPSLTDFASGFDFNSKIMIDGMSGTVNDFLPKFGGNLSSLLDAVAGGGSGSGGGLLKSIIGSISGRTGISAGGVSAILANPTGGLYADGGYTGPGGKHDIAGFVHGGEYVIPKGVVDRIGVGALERTYRGFEAGGYVPPAMPSNVLPMQAPASAMPPMQVTVIDNAGVRVEPKQRRNADGSVSLDVMIDKAVAKKIGQQGTATASALEDRYGAKRSLRQVS